MDLLILLITIAAAVTQAKNKSEKKKERAARQRRSAFEQAEQMEIPVGGSYRPGESSDNGIDREKQRRLKAELRRKHAGRQVAAAQPRQGEPGREGRSRTTAAVTGAWSDEYLGSMLYDSAEGEGHVSRDYRVEELTARSDDHVVRPLTESRHRHTESSITGIEHCPPGQDDQEDAYQAALTRRDFAGIEMGPDKLREAILYSEILSRPRALRRGRI